ncbi:MAG: hypothetical protein ACE14L_11195 [Terriglobales bacterium]
MPPEQTYTIECVRWSIHRHCEALFRLTFRRVWLAERRLWASYLVWAEEVA